MKSVAEFNPRADHRKDRGKERRFVLSKVAGGVAALVGLVSMEAHGSCTNLPTSVPDRIGRLQVFDSRIPDKRVLAGHRDIIWGDAHEKIPGIYSTFYMPADRDFDRSHDIEWYRHNHPDEVVYQCDRRTVANEYKYAFGYYTPVDINNPHVRTRLFSQAMERLTATARQYDAIAVDNVSARNDWKRCGISRAGEWTPLYSGALPDPVFARDMARWVGWLGHSAHEKGMCIAVNLYFHGDDEDGYRQIADQSDIVNDEHGFTRHCQPMDRGQAWIRRATLYAEVARKKPFEIIDYACPALKQIDQRVLNWSIANYLLIKGDRTYLAIVPEGNVGEFVDFPELYIPTGLPLGQFERTDDIFFRRFERALSLVNPFSRAATYDLGKARWKDFVGRPVAGKIVLPGGTGLVLLSAD